jgi:cytochrome P450
VREYAFPMPTVVLAQILGVDSSDHDRFLAWTTAIVEGGGHDPIAARAANQEIYEYLGDQLDDRRARPRDDLLTFLLAAQFEGTTLTRAEQLGIATLLLIAGIDTTANTLATAIWHLAGDQAAQARLRADIDSYPAAVEELLRVFAPVSIARLVTEPVEVAGCPLREGDQVLLSLPAANRDRQRFAQPDDFVFDRFPNPTWRSGPASTAASEPTSPGWSCAWGSRSSSPPRRPSTSPETPPSRGRAVPSAARRRST